MQEIAKWWHRRVLGHGSTEATHYAHFSDASWRITYCRCGREFITRIT